MAASDTDVLLNSGAGGATVAVVQDSAANIHQKVILETQSGTSDPVKLTSDGSGNLNVNLAAGAISSDADQGAFTAGTTAGLPGMGVFNDGLSALTSGELGVFRITALRALKTALQADASGGWTPGHVVSLATTNANSVKGSAGQLGSVIAGNSGAGWAYLKFFNKATAPTVGTDTPVWVVPLPPGGGACPPIPPGLQFTTGIALAITGGAADNDTTAVASGQVVASYGTL